MSDIVVRGKTDKKPKATKKKPTIKHMSFQCDFNSPMNPELAFMDRSEVHIMNISFGLKLENVPTSGATKYEIMDAIKKAAEKAAEKWS